MGQYYTPYIKENNNGLEHTLNAHKFDNGLKLTEHGWYGNSVCNQVLNVIKNNPCSVAWVGDYADFEEDIVNQIDMSNKEFKRVYDLCHTEEICDMPPDDTLTDFDYFVDRYLVNLSKNTYLDMHAFRNRNEFGDGWCLNPLPLLTAVGNGKGGGDYRGINMEDIGMWAFDVLMVTSERPKDFTEEYIDFKEECLYM